MIEVTARQLQPGDFGYEELSPLFAVTVTFKDDEGDPVFAGGNSLVAVETEQAAIAYGENVLVPDLIGNNQRRLAAFAQPAPVEPVEPTEGV